MRDVDIMRGEQESAVHQPRADFMKLQPGDGPDGATCLVDLDQGDIGIAFDHLLGVEVPRLICLPGASPGKFERQDIFLEPSVNYGAECRFAVKQIMQFALQHLKIAP